MSRPGSSYEPLYSSWALSSLVADICQRAGIPYDRINVDILEGSVEGFSASVKNPATGAIQALADVFLFDMANFDGVLHFIPRGGDIIATITEDDLIDDGEDIEQLTRWDSLSIPRVINLEYYDTFGGLTPNKQTSDRSFDNRSVSEANTQTTVIMRADDAARAVVISHKISIEEQRGEIKFSLPDSWLQLTIADCISYRNERYRITEMEIDDGQQHYKAVHDRKSAYESTIQGLPIDEPSDPPGLITSPTIIEIIDSHILRSSDDTLAYYVAVSSETLDWSGATIEISKDGGANYIDSGTIQSNSIMGKLIAPLPSHTEYYRDDINTLSVELLRSDMELLPATMTEMMNRSNLAIIGNELINFSGVTQTSDTTWELTGLLRGRKGSGAVSHLSGERFVMLDRNLLGFVNAELFELNRVLTFRATSFGATDSTIETITYIGRSQRERQPAYLKARIIGPDVEVSWQGVGRIGGSTSVAMGTYFEGYEVSLDGNTLETTNMHVTMSYSPGLLSVRQKNSITGLGPVITMNI